MQTLNEISQAVGELLQQQNLILTTAESCTGGGIAAAITDIAGSSVWFDRAFITYSNQAKMEMIDVDPNTLLAEGAVSEAVVLQMVNGALQHSPAQVAIAVSGIAGPGGGSKKKPVGMVCFAWAIESHQVETTTCYFEGTRSQIREQVVLHALTYLQQRLKVNAK